MFIICLFLIFSPYCFSEDYSIEATDNVFSTPAVESTFKRLFDPLFYEKAYNIPQDTASNHYIKIGFKQGFRPNQWFQTHLYLCDVEAADNTKAPLVHYAENLQASFIKSLSTQWNFVIVGAGYAGSVIAHQLAKAGHSVAIFDKKPFLGGHAHDFYDSNGVLIHLYGPHIFHTNNKKVFEFLSQFTDWKFYEHRVQAHLEGKNYPMPINRTTINELYGLQLTEEECKEYLDSVRVVKEKIENSEDVVLSQVDRDLGDKFFKGYTQKQWQRDLKDLAPDVLKRIPVRTNDDDRYFTDTYQMMPLKGYTEMFHRMLDHPHISKFLGIDFLPIRDQIAYSHLIFTGPIDAFFDYQFGPLPYRSLKFEFEYHPVTQYQKVGTVNFPNDFDYTRITEFKHLTGQKAPGTVILKEYPCDAQITNEPFYPILCKEHDEILAKYQTLAKSLEDAGNTTFIGRLAEYKYYNMDQVTEAAFNTAEKILQKVKIH